MARDGSPHGQHQRYVLPMMAVNLCTGTALQLLAQYVTDLVRLLIDAARDCGSDGVVLLSHESSQFDVRSACQYFDCVANGATISASWRCRT